MKNHNLIRFLLVVLITLYALIGCITNDETKHPAAIINLGQCKSNTLLKSKYNQDTIYYSYALEYVTYDASTMVNCSIRSIKYVGEVSHDTIYVKETEIDSNPNAQALCVCEKPYTVSIFTGSDSVFNYFKMQGGNTVLPLKRI